MAMTQDACQAALALILTDTSWLTISNGIQGAASSGPFWMSLHNGLIAGGNQSTNEVSYTGYSRAQTDRNPFIWQDSAVGGFVEDVAADGIAGTKIEAANLAGRHIDIVRSRQV